jgi:hypothetical protein
MPRPPDQLLEEWKTALKDKKKRGRAGRKSIGGDGRGLMITVITVAGFIIFRL